MNGLNSRIVVRSGLFFIDDIGLRLQGKGSEVPNVISVEGVRVVNLMRDIVRSSSHVGNISRKKKNDRQNFNMGRVPYGVSETHGGILVLEGFSLCIFCILVTTYF